MGYEVSTGLGNAASGAASGAAAGSFIPGLGTGVGAAIGGGIGLASGFFGDDDNDRREEAIRENEDLLAMLRDRFGAARDRDPTETQLFQAGTTAAREQAEREAETDASQAAARGLEGSAFEVAQDQNRARQLGRQTRRLTVDADRVQRQQERSALQAMLQQRGNLNALTTDAARAEERGNFRRGQQVSGAFQNFSSAVLSNPELMESLG